MSECPECREGMSSPVNRTCPATGFQRVRVCVPVTVAPFATPMPTRTKCCGDPVVTSGDKACEGKKNGVCVFTISQSLCIEVPIEFGATATPGDTFVECAGASDRDICTGCGDPSED